MVAVPPGPRHLSWNEARPVNALLQNTGSSVRIKVEVNGRYQAFKWFIHPSSSAWACAFYCCRGHSCRRCCSSPPVRRSGTPTPRRDSVAVPRRRLRTNSGRPRCRRTSTSGRSRRPAARLRTDPWSETSAMSASTPGTAAQWWCRGPRSADRSAPAQRRASKAVPDSLPSEVADRGDHRHAVKTAPTPLRAKSACSESLRTGPPTGWVVPESASGRTVRAHEIGRREERQQGRVLSALAPVRPLPRTPQALAW